MAALGTKQVLGTGGEGGHNRRDRAEDSDATRPSDWITGLGTKWSSHREGRVVWRIKIQVKFVYVE